LIVLLVIVLVVAAASFVTTAGFVVHELGWFPHTKDRKSPADRKFQFRSRYDNDVLQTHGFQVLDPMTEILRRHAHAEIYDVTDPVRSLKNVIARYKEDATESRYDDVVHLANYVCNRVKCDDEVNAVIGEIHELIHSTPPRVSSTAE
jgi:hypothetical protein